MSLVIDNALKSDLKNITKKILNKKRLNFSDALELYNSDDILTIGALANLARINRAKKGQINYAYFINNHHINITNTCEGDCKFCAYKKDSNDPKSYFMTIEQVEEYIKDNITKDVKELHIVSALNKNAGLQYYSDLFKLCKKLLPETHIQALTAVEVDFVSKLENIPPAEVLKELVKSGLGSLPGGGAEIFHESIRKKVCPDKISAERWLEIMTIAHNLNIKSNATMLCGIGEDYYHRVDHLSRIRELQDQTGGFMSIIPLVCHYENTKLTEATNNTGIDNLKDLAISRLFLDNVPHVKAFWIQLGIKLAQVSLAFGVDDLDGTVVKEKISRSAGANKSNLMNKETLINLIKRANRTPVERDTIYKIIKTY